MDARETLERRIDELCRENEQLRQQVASIIDRSFRTADRLHCLETENERLRQIVRCRDCESYRERFNGCVEFGRMEYEEYAIVEPDGFCAWGKRKEA